MLDTARDRKTMKEKTEEKKTKDTGNSKNDNKYLYFYL